MRSPHPLTLTNPLNRYHQPREVTAEDADAAYVAVHADCFHLERMISRTLE